MDTPEELKLPEEEDEPPTDEGDDSKLADGEADEG